MKTNLNTPNKMSALSFVAWLSHGYRFDGTVKTHAFAFLATHLGLILIGQSFHPSFEAANLTVGLGMMWAVTITLSALWLHPVLGLILALFSVASIQLASYLSGLSALIGSVITLNGLGIAVLTRVVYQDDLVRFEPIQEQKLIRKLQVALTSGSSQLLLIFIRMGLLKELEAKIQHLTAIRFPQGTSRAWRNWSGTQSWKPSEVWYPTTPVELKEIVLLAKKEKKNLRVVGSAYSWSPIAKTEDFLVCNCLMRNVDIDLSDPKQPKAIVQTGANSQDLNPLLEKHGYAIPSNVVMETVSWGGLIGVGAHGSGWNEVPLSDRVLGLKLVDGNGNIRSLERGRDPDELLDAVCVSLGTCGVIFEITLSVEPICNVSIEEKVLSTEEVLDNLAIEVPRHDYFDIYWFPVAKRAWLRIANKTQEKRTFRLPQSIRTVQTDRNLWGRWMSVFQTLLFAPLFKVMHHFPSTTPVLCKLRDSVFVSSKKIYGINEFTHYRSAIETESFVGCFEFAFDVDESFQSVRDAWRAVENALQNWEAKGKYPLNWTVNLRFIKNSRCFLSPAKGNGHTCYIEILGLHGEEWQQFADEVCDHWLNLPNARVHWGKQFAKIPNINERLHKNLSEDLNQFRSIRKKYNLDPQDIFVTPFLSDLLFKPAGNVTNVLPISRDHINPIPNQLRKQA